MAKCDLPRYQAHFGQGNFWYLNEDENRSHEGYAWKTMRKLDWGEPELVAMILALDMNVHWEKEVPNCEVLHPEGGPHFMTADQYCIIWHDSERQWYRDVRAGCVTLSLKLTLFTDDDGNEAAGLVTLHFSGSK
ncbi:hypothetical protein CFB44_09955 [Burkholderia sp. AU31280]|nr:hypothetical protein CFB44_09955 [Burkholderia sp. AU31280]